MAETKPRHEIGLVDRKALAISGVVRIERFDRERFVLETDGGPLVITGAQLELKNFDVEAGEVAIEGRIDGLQYVETPDGRTRGWLGKLFR
ncbi:YabP/YqfC family sporulation protein [Hydrogenibacillus sp. N12]|uniref:YabP/YqfC family sporulation protein n=1 Tax=Hydrogenibacillus sp. N12 TaxID=2866627 RepID=UPI001C7DE07A|nr:YabP/YqfC family sporulation protein [Hydrogenibacillus sp. N12]QZA33077.1 sporulation protein YabP [Hydrogenibacillus sp. N12]